MLVGGHIIAYLYISIYIYVHMHIYIYSCQMTKFIHLKNEMGLERTGELAFAENLGSGPNTHIADHNSL